MRFFELEGAVFRGENFPVEIRVGDSWKPYQGDRARVMMFGNEISQEEAEGGAAPAASEEQRDPAVQE